MDPAEVDTLTEARARVLERMERAAVRAGREPAGITLVAVSKTVPADRLRAAVAAGLDRLGENRVQEGEAKLPEVAGARWELVGPLQSNKARRALATFDRIQTVDSVELARRLDRLVPETRPGARYPVLLQVNVDRDPAKAGFQPDAIEGALGELLALPNLLVEGLMTVGRLTTSAGEARDTFRGLHALADRLRTVGPALGETLSMGMSDDFELAIEEGATLVRVGRALFGDRHHRHPDDGAPHDH